MKRAFFFAAIVFLGLIYYSAGSPMEVADRVMVHAIGIDPVEDGYRVTLQVFSPASGGSETAIDPSQPNVSLVKGEGGSAAEAIHDCESRLGGHVFIGQNRIILFGRDTDLSRDKELFGYFLGSSEAYLNTECAAAEGSAEKLLSLPIPSNVIASDKFVTMINSERERGCTLSCTLMQLLEAMETPHKCAVMPLFSALPDKSGGDKAEGGSEPKKLGTEAGLVLKKCAVFSGGQYAGELSGERAGLLGMINGSGSSVFTETEYGGRRLGKTYRLEAREVTAERRGDELWFYVRCKADPRDEQYFSDPAEREGFTKAARESLSAEAADLAEELCAEGLPELLGADRDLRRHFPALLRTRGMTDELFARVRYEISVE